MAVYWWSRGCAGGERGAGAGEVIYRLAESQAESRAYRAFRLRRNDGSWEQLHHRR
jgi:hypothetical protein